MATSECTEVDFAVDCRFIAPMNEGPIDKSNPTLSTSETQRFLENHTIGVIGERIKAILPTVTFYTLYTPVKRLNLSGENCILIPGLINCHTHTPLSLLRGYADDQPLEKWLKQYIWPTEDAFVDASFVRVGAELSVYEMLKSGTTLFNDMYYLPEEVVKVCKKAHIRLATGHPGIENGKVDENHSLVDEGINFAERYLSYKDALVKPVLLAHALYSLSLKHHKQLVDASKRLNIVFHTHLNETKSESAVYASQSGLSTVQALLQIGALNPNSLLAHCVWLTNEERELFAKYKPNVCHCPRSNMKLGSGICDVKALLELGVNVCLGTDSACTNNSLDMLTEAQSACLLAKVHSLDASVLDDYTALRMCTINGAKALLCEKEIGSLEVGKLCDMVCVDLGSLENLPIYDPISCLIYTNQRKIRYSWIGGRMVVEEGEVVFLKPNISEISEIVGKLKNFKLHLENSTTV